MIWQKWLMKHLFNFFFICLLFIEPSRWHSFLFFKNIDKDYFLMLCNFMQICLLCNRPKDCSCQREIFTKLSVLWKKVWVGIQWWRREKGIQSSGRRLLQRVAEVDPGVPDARLPIRCSLRTTSLPLGSHSLPNWLDFYQELDPSRVCFLST